MVTGQRTTQRRGDELRRHILLSAKDVFLETGYERASMDAVAARAGTSKRSLYAHFLTKDDLFIAVLELVRELYLGQLKEPADYADDPVEAVVTYCARFRSLLVWDSQVRTCRLSIGEAERHPEAGRTYYDAMLASAYDRLAAHLQGQLRMPKRRAGVLARDLLDRTALPALTRCLLGVDRPAPRRPGGATPTRAELAAVRPVVEEALAGRA